MMEEAAHHTGCEPAPASVSCCDDHRPAQQAFETATAPPSSRLALLVTETPPMASGHLGCREPTSQHPTELADLLCGSPPLFTLFSALLI